MGRRQYRNMLTTLPEEQWQDLVITTALLLGSDDNTPVLNPQYRTFTYPQALRWKRMVKWLWEIHGIHVRRDGTIYQRPENHPTENN